MKKRLFAGVLTLLFYSLFIFGFSLAENQGQIEEVITKIGFTDATPLANEDGTLNGNLIDPTPEPKKPPPRPPK